MKFAYATLLLLLAVFVARDAFHVISLWSYYRPQDVAVHATFAVGAINIVVFNVYFMLITTPLNFPARVKLLLSFFGQVAALGLFSVLIIAAWKGYWFEKSGPNAVWSNLGSICILLFLLLVLVRLILWSKRQSIPNPPFKRDT